MGLSFGDGKAFLIFLSQLIDIVPSIVLIHIVSVVFPVILSFILISICLVALFPCLLSGSGLCPRALPPAANGDDAAAAAAFASQKVSSL